jgi:DNA-binding NarL/FixJ family response regulator
MTKRTDHAPEIVQHYYDQHRLKPKHKAILDAYEEHKSYEKVAAALNLNVGTVKSRLNRARGHLAAEIATDAAASEKGGVADVGAAV